MVGLRTQENPKFLPFFEIIQKEANKANSVFFLDCGEGNSVFSENIICTDCSGWLIPDDKCEEFNKQFAAFGELDEKWDEFAAWVKWSGNPQNPQIEIKSL